MLEWLSEQESLEWEYSEVEAEMFAAELGVSAAETMQIVAYCIKLGLLSEGKDGILYSEGLKEQLSPLFEKRERERLRYLEKTSTPTKGQSKQTERENKKPEIVSAAETTQSRVEYSKEEESKDSKDTITAAVPFSKFWDTYGKKQDKDKCSKKWATLSEADQKLIMADIPRYKASLRDLQFQKYPLTYLNGRCWLDERDGQVSPPPESQAELPPEVATEQARRKTHYDNYIFGFSEYAGKKIDFPESMSLYHLKKGYYHERKQ